MGCIYTINAKFQPTQSVLIKSIEQNMTCVYEARRRIMVVRLYELILPKWVWLTERSKGSLGVVVKGVDKFYIID